MNSTELRIGNHIQKDGKIVKCTIYNLVDIDKNLQSNYEPIEITKGILEKNKIYGDFKIKGAKIEMHQHFAYDHIWFFTISNNLSIELKYIHELENLMLDLDNKKINI